MLSISIGIDIDSELTKGIGIESISKPGISSSLLFTYYTTRLHKKLHVVCVLQLHMYSYSDRL